MNGITSSSGGLSAQERATHQVQVIAGKGADGKKQDSLSMITALAARINSSVKTLFRSIGDFFSSLAQYLCLSSVKKGQSTGSPTLAKRSVSVKASPLPSPAQATGSQQSGSGGAFAASATPSPAPTSSPSSSSAPFSLSSPSSSSSSSDQTTPLLASVSDNEDDDDDSQIDLEEAFVEIDEYTGALPSVVLHADGADEDVDEASSQPLLSLSSSPLSPLISSVEAKRKQSIITFAQDFIEGLLKTLKERHVCDPLIQSSRKTVLGHLDGFRTFTKETLNQGVMEAKPLFQILASGQQSRMITPEYQTLLGRFLSCEQPTTLETVIIEKLGNTRSGLSGYPNEQRLCARIVCGWLYQGKAERPFNECNISGLTGNLTDQEIKKYLDKALKIALKHLAEKKIDALYSTISQNFELLFQGMLESNAKPLITKLVERLLSLTDQVPAHQIADDLVEIVHQDIVAQRTAQAEVEKKKKEISKGTLVAADVYARKFAEQRGFCHLNVRQMLNVPETVRVQGEKAVQEHVKNLEEGLYAEMAEKLVQLMLPEAPLQQLTDIEIFPELKAVFGEADALCQDICSVKAQGEVKDLLKHLQILKREVGLVVQTTLSDILPSRLKGLCDMLNNPLKFDELLAYTILPCLEELLAYFSADAIFWEHIEEMSHSISDQMLQKLIDQEEDELPDDQEYISQVVEDFYKICQQTSSSRKFLFGDKEQFDRIVRPFITQIMGSLEHLESASASDLDVDIDLASDLKFDINPVNIEKLLRGYFDARSKVKGETHDDTAQRELLYELLIQNQQDVAEIFVSKIGDGDVKTVLMEKLFEAYSARNLARKIPIKERMTQADFTKAMTPILRPFVSSLNKALKELPDKGSTDENEKLVKATVTAGLKRYTEGLKKADEAIYDVFYKLLFENESLFGKMGFPIEYLMKRFGKQAIKAQLNGMIRQRSFLDITQKIVQSRETAWSRRDENDIEDKTHPTRLNPNRLHDDLFAPKNLNSAEEIEKKLRQERANIANLAEDLIAQNVSHISSWPLVGRVSSFFATKLVPSKAIEQQIDKVRRLWKDSRINLNRTEKIISAVLRALEGASSVAENAGVASSSSSYQQLNVSSAPQGTGKDEKDK